MRSKVVLPHPDGPSSVKNSFSRMTIETASSATIPAPKDLLRPLTSMAAMLLSFASATTLRDAHLVNGARPWRGTLVIDHRRDERLAIRRKGHVRASLTRQIVCLDEGLAVSGDDGDAGFGELADPEVTVRADLDPIWKSIDARVRVDLVEPQEKTAIGKRAIIIH